MIPVNFWVLAGALILSAAGAYIFLGPADRPKRRRKGPLQGLPNLGKICFINAVLQALVACPSCVFWITNIAESVEKRLFQNYPLIRALLAVFNALKGNGEQCSAAAVMEALRFHRWQISDEEQDAHEFYHVLTTTIEEELIAATPILSLFEASKLQDEKSKQNGITLKQKYSPASNLYIMKSLSPTKGFLASELKCNSCNSKYPTRYDTFNSISLAIPTINWGQLTLLDLLQKFISYELIQDVSCDICARNSQSSDYTVCLSKSKTSFLKQLSFSKLPRCLCIHIQRTIWLSNGLPVKSNEHVIFPEVLVMDNYVHRPCKTRKLASTVNGKHNREDLSDNSSLVAKSSNDIKYSISNSIVENASGAKQLRSHSFVFLLKAVIVHLGDVSSGHFITYRRRVDSDHGDRKWFRISDTVVTEVTFTEVSQCCAYMLFYEKVH